MELIYGKDVADILTKEIVYKVSALARENKRLPKLAIVRVGEKPGDISYEKSAIKCMEKCGIEHVECTFSEDVDKGVFLSGFKKINVDKNIDGILVLRPLPKDMDEAVAGKIAPDKDVDCISHYNMGKLLAGEKDCFAPCTALAVEKTLKYILDKKGESLRGKKVTIVGRSTVVGKPLSLLLTGDDATVTLCHTKTVNLARECAAADILVAAAGSAKLIKEEHVKEGAILTDVGVNMDENGKLVGDIDLFDVGDKALFATPVPKGIGAVTTTILAMQVLKARMMHE